MFWDSRKVYNEIVQSIDEALGKLKHSKFRSSFRLNEKDREYIKEKGRDVIENHARDFVKQKLADGDPLNDGKQTPMRGHPIFKAMHGTACCCRGCLNKWYKVPRHTPLTEMQQEKIVRLLMAWIDEQMKEETDE